MAVHTLCVTSSLHLFFPAASRIKSVYTTSGAATAVGDSEDFVVALFVESGDSASFR